MRSSRFDDLIVYKWGARFQGRWFRCAIGHGGIRSEKHEGDGATPVGIWRLTNGMWRGDRLPRPPTLLNLRKAGPQDKWSDDPRDPAYNQPVRGIHWRFSHERMRRSDPLYDIVLVTDHNSSPPVPGLGSAIFVHCWRAARHPTAGCVAFQRDDLLWIMKRWTNRSRLVIRR